MRQYLIFPRKSGMFSWLFSSLKAEEVIPGWFRLGKKKSLSIIIPTARAGNKMSIKFPKDFYLRALIYPDDGRHIAHCLEMDLVGFGDTPQEAIDDLHDHVLMQVSFAHSRKNPALLWHPAPKKLFAKFEKLVEERIKGTHRARKYDLAQVPYPDPDEIPAMAVCNA